MPPLLSRSTLHVLTIALLLLACTPYTACITDRDPDITITPEDMSSAPGDASADLAPVDMLQEVDSATQDLGGEVDMPQDMPADAAADMPAAPIVLPEKPWDVAVRGPYNVGYTRGEFTYASKPDGEPRTIDVVFWHPTLDVGGRGARYMRDLIQVGKAYKNASVPAAPTTFPMLVFSHGNSSIAEQSYTFTEHFASHGWIVVAPYHTNNSIFDNEGSINYSSSIYRAQDISALLDWTTSLTQEEHPLGGRMDHDKIIMSGHSFGAFTTMAIAGAQFDLEAIRQRCDAGTIKRALCDLFTEDLAQLFAEGFHDPRIKAAIPQTPGIGPVFEDGVAEITIPMLMMTARRDVQLPTEENGAYMWARMGDGPHALFDMPNGGHFTYSDMCNLFGTAIPEARDDGCNDTFISAGVALPMINHYGLAWAEYHILKEMRHEPLISGALRPYAEQDMVYTTKTAAQQK